MFARRMGWVAVALLVTAGSVLAQNDAPGGDRPGGGGPGGFGGRGGFGRMGGDRNSYLGVLQIKEVRDEIKVTEKQDETVAGIRDEIRAMPRPEGLPDFRTLRDLPEAEQAAARSKLEEFAATREKEAHTKLAAVLDESQMKRLRGLWVQRIGAVDALNNADVATELKLTDDQKTQLTAQREEQRAAMRGGFRGRGEGNAPPPAGAAGGNFLERMQEMRKASDDKAVSVLTDEQKTAFAAIQGDAFTFPPPQAGGGRGGFGRGRDRGEGGERPANAPEREAL